MEINCCKGCRFYLDAGDPGALPMTDEDWGYCYRYPPVLNSLEIEENPLVLSDDGVWVRPLVRASDWCGEWQPLPPEEKSA